MTFDSLLSSMRVTCLVHLSWHVITISSTFCMPALSCTSRFDTLPFHEMYICFRRCLCCKPTIESFNVVLYRVFILDRFYSGLTGDFSVLLWLMLQTGFCLICLYHYFRCWIWYCLDKKNCLPLPTEYNWEHILRVQFYFMADMG